MIYYVLPNKSGEIAQLVERRTHKPKVKGSIPFLATIQRPLGALNFFGENLSGTFFDTRCWNFGIMHEKITLSRGVVAAQGFLIPLVLVRTQAGQPYDIMTP